MTTHQLQNEKEIIIIWINKLEDSALISKIKNLMNSSDKCLLSDEQKVAINKGLLELLIKQNIDFKASDFKRTCQVPIVKQITLFYKI